MSNGDSVPYPGGEAEGGGGGNTLVGNIVYYNGRRWQVKYASYRDPTAGPGGTRQLVLEALDNRERIPFPGRGTYIGSDKKEYIVDPNARILGNPRTLSQSEFDAFTSAGATGDLIPAIDPATGEPIPGLYINPNTGGLVDLSSGAGGDGGYSAPQWRPGEQEMEQERLDAQTRLDNANAALLELQAQGNVPMSEYERQMLEVRRDELELQRLQAENDLKELVYSQGMAERRALIAEKGETQRAIMSLGPDPFRQAATLTGGMQRGITPQQLAVGQAQEFLETPLPEVGMDMDLAQLDKAIAQMQAVQQPYVGGFGVANPYGFAEGGVIDMERGSDSAFSMKGRKHTFLVGDGAGIIPGVTEALTVGDGKVEVTPLAGFAQEGLTPEEERQLRLSTTYSLAPLYEGFGLTGFQGSGVPRVQQQGNLGYFRPTGGAFRNLDMFSTLGYQPQLIRFTRSGVGGRTGEGDFNYRGDIFYRDPTTGVLQRLRPDAWEQSGFRQQDVVNVQASQIPHFTFGKPILEAAGISQAPVAGFGALGTPVMEATSGAILPGLHKVAGRLMQWRAAGDPRYGVAVSAYGNALDPMTGEPIGGVSPEYIDAIIRRFTPGAGAFGRRIGFVGGLI